MMMGLHTPELQPKDNVAAEPWGPKSGTSNVSSDVAERGKAPAAAGGKNGFMLLSKALYLFLVLSNGLLKFHAQTLDV